MARLKITICERQGFGFGFGFGVDVFEIAAVMIVGGVVPSAMKRVLVVLAFHAIVPVIR